MGTKIDATDIAKPYRDDVKAKIAELKKNGIGKHLQHFSNEYFPIIYTCNLTNLLVHGT